MTQVLIMVGNVGHSFSMRAVYFVNISRFANASKTSRIKQTTQTSIPNKPKEIINKDLTIYARPRGRLGNIMFELASALGIANKNRRPLVIPPNMERAIKKIFQPTQTKYYSVGNVPNGTHIEKELSPFGNEQTRFFSLPETPLKLNGFFQSWRYFSNISSQIRDIFTLPETIRNESRNYMRELREKIKVNNITFVAIHVRCGDYNSQRHYNMGVRLPQISYIIKAMDYFRTYYKNVHFIICSDDSNWCYKEMSAYPNITVFHNSVRRDFATLVACDHMIVTYGSFGWWAAWLNGGDVVYFDTPYGGHKEFMNKQMKENHYLPEWNPIGN